MKRLLALLLLLGSTAHAADLRYDWDHATVRTDGQPITGERSYVIRYSIDNIEQPIINVGDVTSYTLPDITPGVYTSQIATIEDGRQGDWSPAITTIVEATEPANPGTVTITVQLTGCDNCGLEVK
ncbi:MAG: hypothetical protein R3352_05320 [Salinisphaeraceae bacterium]|nr:hypothetical protein [Salinisphaeraceae bacterium]